MIDYNTINLRWQMYIGKTFIQAMHDTNFFFS